jgi:hypothetical protein
MPKIQHRNIPKIHSLKVKRMLNDRRFKRLVAQHHTIDKNYDIPYIAGYSEDSRVIYIDRHLNTKMNDVDVTQLIVIHEIVEKTLSDLFNLKYQQAHHIATYIEHEQCIKAGINWKKYNKFLDPQMKHIWQNKIKKIPKFLDLKPYKDEKDFELLRRMRSNAR